MDWLDVVWDADTEQYIALHGLTRQDVVNALWFPTAEDSSDSSGRPVRFGHALDGRLIIVVFEMMDHITVMPITAYEVK